MSSRVFPPHKKPEAGFVIGGLWKYEVVLISERSSWERPGWSATTMVKHRTLEAARADADQMWNDHVEYAKARGGEPGAREYYVAEWTMNDKGEIILVLLDNPE